MISHYYHNLIICISDTTVYYDIYGCRLVARMRVHLFTSTLVHIGTILISNDIFCQRITAHHIH